MNLTIGKGWHVADPKIQGRRHAVPPHDVGAWSVIGAVAIAASILGAFTPVQLSGADISVQAPAPSNPAAPPAHRAEGPTTDSRDALLFHNGDTLYGSLELIDPAVGVRWHHSDAPEAMEFFADSLSEIRFGYRPQPQLNLTNACQFRLNNQDELEGNLISSDAERLTLETWYAGRIEMPRKYVQLVMPRPAERPPIFEGPTGLEGWTMGLVQASVPNAGQWSYKNGAFYATQSASVARDLKLPPVASIQFDLNWKGTLYIAIALYTDYMQPVNLLAKETGPDFGGFYSLQLNPYSVDLRPVTKLEPLRSLGQTSVPTFNQKNKAHLEVRANQPKRTVALLVDGLPIKQWIDIDEKEMIGQGTGVRFVHQGQGSVKLSHLRVTEWDGQFEEKPSSAPDSKNDQARLQNGDKVLGNLERIQDGKVTFALPEGTVLDIPLNRVKLLEMAGQKTERLRDDGANARATFRRGGSITFHLEKWDQQEVVATTPYLGKLVFNPAAFERVQFLPLGRPKPSASASREALGGRAVVRAVRGAAHFQVRDANWEPLRVGQVLASGSKVQTGAETVVDLFLGDNGPIVRITPNSLLSLMKLDLRKKGPEVVVETLLKLDKGLIRGNVQKLAPGSSWQVLTAKGLVDLADGGGFEVQADPE